MNSRINTPLTITAAMVLATLTACGQSDDSIAEEIAKSFDFNL